MICILHGYLLEGSGSNLWTRSVVESLCRQGETVHLVTEEPHPELYPFIEEARRYHPDGECEVFLRREGPYPGRCILHKPLLGDTLPVYVWDRYEEFPHVVPMVELSDLELDDYLDRNTRALLRIVRENPITALHANHCVLMSVVAQRVHEATGIPYAVMPHGSALEYAVKRDARYQRLAVGALGAARRVFVIGDEIRERVRAALPEVTDLDAKVVELRLGVDTARFEPVPRGERRSSIQRLEAALAGLPRGRTREQGEALRARLRPGMGAAELAEAMLDAGRYDGKAPDADLEERLATVDWEEDATLLFVGRLISTKGCHGVIVALPLLLARRPDLRLVIVGHGPLREPLEALLWALEHGERDLVEHIVRQGRALEGAPEGEGGGTELTMAARFLERLAQRGELDAYYEAARRHVRADRVIFTGYLTHRELRHLFPCCDAAIFPSVVKEAGPMVFLEALASGAFPLGTYFGGMKASIDSVEEALPPGVAAAMRLHPDPERTVEDMVRNVPLALEAGREHREALSRLARESYDWNSVARTLRAELEAL